MVLAVSLQIWGLLLKKRIYSIRSKFFPFRVALNEEGDGLDYLMRKYIFFPLEQNI